MLGQDSETPLSMAVMNDREDAVKLLLVKGETKNSLNYYCTYLSRTPFNICMFVRVLFIVWFYILGGVFWKR